jgi:hypothetical protein
MGNVKIFYGIVKLNNLLLRRTNIELCSNAVSSVGEILIDKNIPSE